MVSLNKLCFAVFCLGALVFFSETADSGVSNPESDHTMLMFVGENLEVLTIASRREESAAQAPAVADVITFQDLDKWGVFTLRDALSRMPGFYMGQKEWGTQPYLRGIPNSILFLYDTVPLSSALRKSYHPIDYDLSMAGVKRIEIVRGPGSVLWGPDAFAGIVNIVPKTGGDLKGVETEVLYGNPGDRRGFSVNAGNVTGNWDYFVSASGYEGELDSQNANVVSFWGDGKQAIDADDRYGEDWPSNSRYFELSGRLAFKDWLTLSGRVADNQRAYTMILEEDDLSWIEVRDNPNAFIKLEGRKALTPFSSLRFTGSYNSMEDEHRVIDRAFFQKESMTYGEILYDQSSKAGNGLFTGGLSFREKRLKDAIVWDGYLPDYLKPDNVSLLPIPEDIDFRTRLWSIFGQYNHRVGDYEGWLGIRYDDHNVYADRISMNAGVSWNPKDEWILKLLYGTAYRTPVDRQLQVRQISEPENIQSLNFLVGWKPNTKWGVEICTYLSRIDDHVMEDLYAGLSEPNHQNLYGVEIQSHYSPIKALNLYANFSLIKNKGPDETYFYNDYTDIPPEGPEEPHFIELHYPYDAGPDTLFNFIGDWHATENITLSARARYFSSRKLIYLRNADFFVDSSDSGEWLLDMNLSWKNFVRNDLEFEISGENLTDREYKTPGTYSAIDGDPMVWTIQLKKKW